MKKIARARLRQLLTAKEVVMTLLALSCLALLILEHLEKLSPEQLKLVEVFARAIAASGSAAMMSSAALSVSALLIGSYDPLTPLRSSGVSRMLFFTDSTKPRGVFAFGSPSLIDWFYWLFDTVSYTHLSW